MARVLFSAAGGVMVLLGLLSIGYGVVFFDGGMFALFDGKGCLALGMLAVMSGIIVLVFARRSIRAM